MRIISWNVNGLRAVLKKNFVESLKPLGLDVICLQEIKSEKDQLPSSFHEDPYLKSFPYKFFHPAKKKGYSGVSIFSKKEPIRLIEGIGNEDFDTEGRVLIAEFESFYLLSCYFPNSQDQLARIDYKLSFCRELEFFLENLSPKKEIVLCGDVNVAHEEIDLTNPKQNVGNPGFAPEERAWLSGFLSEKKYTDVFRKRFPDKVAYSWWSYRSNAREKNVGWRIDYFLTTKKVYEKTKEIEILKDILGSDHCPILIDFEENLA